MHPENQLSIFRDLQRFCAIHDKEELRRQLWAWLVEALSSENACYESAEARGDLLCLYEEMVRLLGMVYEMTTSVT